MTRICSWCSTTIGEKCPRCHSLAVQRTDSLDRFFCDSCHLLFAEGEGGATHGVCAPLCPPARASFQSDVERV